MLKIIHLCLKIKKKQTLVIFTTKKRKKGKMSKKWAEKSKLIFLKIKAFQIFTRCTLIPKKGHLCKKINNFQTKFTGMIFFQHYKLQLITLEKFIPVNFGFSRHHSYLMPPLLLKSPQFSRHRSYSRDPSYSRPESSQLFPVLNSRRLALTTKGRMYDACVQSA